jgi:hypothetical protein
VELGSVGLLALVIGVASPLPLEEAKKAATAT